METTYFVLGMLTIVVVVILTALIVGMVKIIKLEKQLNNSTFNLHQDIDYINRRIDKEIEDAHRHIQHEVEEIQKHEHELETVLHRDIDETRRYIDSRIDKVVATGSLTSAKRQING